MKMAQTGKGVQRFAVVLRVECEFESGRGDVFGAAVIAETALRMACVHLDDESQSVRVVRLDALELLVPLREVMP